MAKKPDSGDKARFWLLATFVVAATVGVMVWAKSGGEEDGPSGDAAQSADSADEEVLEVQPLIPHGKIVSASWRKDGEAPARDEQDDDVSTSLLDGTDMDPFGENADKVREKQDSLKKVVDRIHGLGVYVAPPDDEDDDR